MRANSNVTKLKEHLMKCSMFLERQEARELAAMEPGLRDLVATCTKERPLEIGHEIAKAIYMDVLPYRFVHDASVKSFFERICPGFKMPTKYEFDTKLLMDVYEETKIMANKEIAKSPYFAVTMDSWYRAS